MNAHCGTRAFLRILRTAHGCAEKGEEMRESNRDSDLRSSALWGSGGRGGEGRASALWGKGGRGFVMTAVAVFALSAPIAASANANTSSDHGGDRDKTFVASDLTKKAKSNPNQLV